MHNVLILGSGRSGTSMTAGLLGQAGYFFGSHLLKASAANPKGFFEDKVVNAINEAILGQAIRHSRLPRRWNRFAPRSPVCRGELWLTILERPVDWQLSRKIAARIRTMTRQAPFAFKDPRFCYTLNGWRPQLPKCRFLCVFRHPMATCQSMVSFANRFHPGLRLTMAQAQRIWLAMYRQVIDFHFDNSREWLFVSFQDLLDGTSLATIERFLEVRLDRQFVDRRLVTPAANHNVGAHAMELYGQLQELAERTHARFAKAA